METERQENNIISMIMAPKNRLSDVSKVRFHHSRVLCGKNQTQETTYDTDFI